MLRFRITNFSGILDGSARIRPSRINRTSREATGRRPWACRGRDFDGLRALRRTAREAQRPRTWRRKTTCGARDRVIAESRLVTRSQGRHRFQEHDTPRARRRADARSSCPVRRACNRSSQPPVEPGCRCGGSRRSNSASRSRYGCWRSVIRACSTASSSACWAMMALAARRALRQFVGSADTTSSARSQPSWANAQPVLSDPEC